MDNDVPDLGPVLSDLADTLPEGATVSAELIKTITNATDGANGVNLSTAVTALIGAVIALEVKYLS